MFLCIYLYIFHNILSWNFIVYFGKNIINIEQLIGFIKKNRKNRSRSEKTYGAAFVERLDDTKRPTTINST